jgi:phosphatidate cytidylyltransferase
MKKIFQRLIVFIVGLPVLFLLVVLLPQYNHFCLNLVIIIFSVLGAVELRNILSHKNLHISVPETIFFGAISPVAWTVMVTFGLTDRNIVSGAFILGATWLLVSGIFTSQEKLNSYIGRIATGFTLMIYPGFLAAWMVRMAEFREAGMVILIFFLVVLLNDSAAWFTGVLFGKGNRGVFAASPNKSVAGFTGGLCVSVATGITATVLIPSAFSSTVMPSILAGLLLGLLAGAAATLGDLSESAIKRSAGVKDSGAIVLGRGGALDSIDSLLLAAPVYFLMYRALFDKI